MMLSARSVLVAVAALAVSACSQLPDLTLPDVLVPQTWMAKAVEPAEEPPLPPDRWWTAFGSTVLDRLVERALAENNDLAAAVARITQAQAQVQAAGSALWPGVSGSGGAARSLYKPGSGTESGSGKGDAKKDKRNTFSLGLSASYELDFWGRDRAAVEAAEASLTATRFDRETVALTLSADVTTTYLSLLALNDRMASTRRQLENARAILEVGRRRNDWGRPRGWNWRSSAARWRRSPRRCRISTCSVSTLNRRWPCCWERPPGPRSWTKVLLPIFRCLRWRRACRPRSCCAAPTSGRPRPA